MFSFLLVGAYAATRKRSTTEDYLLASRSVSPWLTALSAAATINSGYMFIGLIGFTYSVGISAMWLMVGWISGDYLAWRFIHEKVRRRSQEEGWLTILSFLGEGLGAAGSGSSVRVRSSFIIHHSSFITLLFLGFYAAAQLKAGSKALHVLFGWNEAVGVVIGALIVGLYCLFGGIRASIWTDAIQSVIMLGTMLVLLFVATSQIWETGVSSFFLTRRAGHGLAIRRRSSSFGCSGETSGSDKRLPGPVLPISEKTRCSMGFDLDAPGGWWQTVTIRRWASHSCFWTPRAIGSLSRSTR